MRRPQEDHADLGLVPDSDHTEDMRRSARDSSSCTFCTQTDTVNSGLQARRTKVIDCLDPSG